MEYFDVEAHADEFEAAISLGTARRICDLLSLDLLALVQASGSGHELTPETFWRRHDLITRRRVELGLSDEELGERIGFGPTFVQFLERTPDFIESVPIGVLRDLADALGLALADLLGVRR